MRMPVRAELSASFHSSTKRSSSPISSTVWYHCSISVIAASRMASLPSAACRFGITDPRNQPSRMSAMASRSSSVGPSPWPCDLRRILAIAWVA